MGELSSIQYCFGFYAFFNFAKPLGVHACAVLDRKCLTIMVSYLRWTITIHLQMNAKLNCSYMEQHYKVAALYAYHIIRAECT